MALSLPPGARLVAATHNPGKAKELAALLEGRFEVVAAGALGLPEPDETETTFVGNAILKARAAADRSGMIALADDSGLSVRTLDGAPGIFSARWAGPGKDFAVAMDKVRERLEEIADTVERVARQHSLTPYLAVARITHGQLLIARRRPAEGVELIRRAVEVLHQCRYEMVTSLSMGILAKGLSDMSLHSAALAMCDEVETLIRTCGDFLRMPGLLAIRGHCLAAAGRPEESEKSYLASIELSRSQGVKSGQLQAAVAFAQHLISAGRSEDARRLLRPLVEDAGGETSLDLSLARSLLG